MAEPSNEMRAPATRVRRSVVPRASRDGNLRGALWMLASGVGFTGYLVLAKLLSADVHPVVLAFARSFVGLLVVLPLAVRRGPSFFHTPRPGLIGLRSIFGTLGFIFSLLAISDYFELPLSQFNALSFSRPLFVTILAAVFLRELVGGHRWGAVAVGFFGVLVMAVPGVVFFWADLGEAAVTLDLGAVLAILSALSFAGAIVLVKNLSTTHTPMQLLAWSNLLSTVLLVIPAAIYWTSVTPQAFALMVAMALVGLAAQYCYVQAMAIGDASFLSTMDYVRLPLAAAADWLLFKLLPGLYVWLGAGIIVAATLYITVREARKRRAPVP